MKEKKHSDEEPKKWYNTGWGLLIPIVLLGVVMAFRDPCKMPGESITPWGKSDWSSFRYQVESGRCIKQKFGEYISAEEHIARHCPEAKKINPHIAARMGQICAVYESPEEIRRKYKEHL